MQTSHHSRLEVGVDFGLSVLVNLGAQIGIYGALATAQRSLTFATLVLALAMPRRYVIRRLFNAWVAPGTRQTRRQAWLEVSIDTALAIVIAILLQRMVYGAEATLTKAGSVTMLLYAITMGRRYALRRLFDAWEARQIQASIL